MLDRRQKAKLSLLIQTGCLTLLCVLCSGSQAYGINPSSSVVCRPDLSSSRRLELAAKLREITGWPRLDFDEDGALRFGGHPTGGSQTARDLLIAATNGSNLSIIEDASNRDDTIFCRVVEGRWKRDAAQKPPAYIVLIDFADFSHVMGDKAALAAFNVGWSFLHEIAHVVHNSPDTAEAGDVGECESLINRMRRECGLAERADYFYTFFPGTEQNVFMTKLVRLAFDRQPTATNKKKRYWLIWDANLVGGLKQQLAATR